MSSPASVFQVENPYFSLTFTRVSFTLQHSLFMFDGSEESSTGRSTVSRPCPLLRLCFRTSVPASRSTFHVFDVQMERLLIQVPDFFKQSWGVGPCFWNPSAVDGDASMVHGPWSMGPSPMLAIYTETNTETNNDICSHLLRKKNTSCCTVLLCNCWTMNPASLLRYSYRFPLPPHIPQAKPFYHGHCRNTRK